MPNEATTAALEQLENGISSLLESDRWTEYLDTQARFHRYSPNNTILIMLQCPDASRVAGYQAWKKDHKRQVRKGEKGIRILAPCSVWKDKDNHDAGRKLIGFRVVSVFDISQTDGDAMPEIVTPLQGEADTEILERLISMIKDHGFTYHLEPTGDASNGFTDFTNRRVVVDPSLSPAMRTKTTAHELGHALLHNPDDPERPTARGLLEAEAEAVAYVVCHAAGIAAGDYSLGYIAEWSNGDTDVVSKVAVRVQRAAKRIITHLEASTEQEVAA